MYIKAPGMVDIIGLSVKRRPALTGTYVVDKRTGNDSNTGLSSAQAWKTLKKVNDSVPGGTYTVEIVEGSGPYDVTDLGSLSQNAFYLRQNATSDITYNFNGNALRGDRNVNTPSYKWTRSTASGKDDWYYLTMPNGVAPTTPQYDGTLVTLPQVKTAIVNGSWAAETANLVAAWTPYGRYITDNWAWGDFDSLGFSTVYVRFNGGNDPTGTGVPILVNSVTSVLIAGGSGGAVHRFNDAILGGAKTDIINCSSIIELNRCNFDNADYGVLNLNSTTLGQSYTARFCVFRDCGHQVVQFNRQHNFTMLNSHVENAHVIAKLPSNTDCTLKLRNITTKNLMAGAIQCDNPTPTVDEDYCQYHIEPESTHGVKAIAFTTGTRYWLTTGAHSLPANTATSGVAAIDTPTGNGLRVGTAAEITGTANLYEADGIQIYSGTTQLPDGPWLDGVDIGPYAYVVGGKYYLSLLGPAGAQYWPSAPELIAITGVDNAVYNADGTGKEFASKELALAALASLADDTYLFGGTKGAALYSVDKSAKAALIKKYLADVD